MEYINEEVKNFCDVDSVVLNCEAMEILAAIKFENLPAEEREIKILQITEITNGGMNGKSFNDSLRQRLEIIQPHRDDIAKLVDVLKGRISQTFLDHKDKIQDFIFISGGFKNWLDPVLAELGIKDENIYGNEMFFDEAGNYAGFNNDNPLAHNEGKAHIINNIPKGNEKKRRMTGDGFTDYETLKLNAVDEFYLYTEFVIRESLLQHASRVVRNLDFLDEVVIVMEDKVDELA